MKWWSLKSNNSDGIFDNSYPQNLHIALDEEMAAHEATEAELQKMEEKFNASQKRINELNSERREVRGFPRCLNHR